MMSMRYRLQLISISIHCDSAPFPSLPFSTRPDTRHFVRGLFHSRCFDWRKYIFQIFVTFYFAFYRFCHLMKSAFPSDVRTPLFNNLLQNNRFTNFYVHHLKTFGLKRFKYRHVIFDVADKPTCSTHMEQNVILLVLKLAITNTSQCMFNFCWYLNV